MNPGGGAASIGAEGGAIMMRVRVTRQQWQQESLLSAHDSFRTCKAEHQAAEPTGSLYAVLTSACARFRMASTSHAIFSRACAAAVATSFSISLFFVSTTRSMAASSSANFRSDAACRTHTTCSMTPPNSLRDARSKRVRAYRGRLKEWWVSC